LYACADWIIFLEQGRLKIQGTVEDLRQVDGEHLDFLDDVILSFSDAMNRVST